MKIKLVGYELVDYTNKNNKPVKGISFYGIDLTSKKDTLDGYCLFNQFLSESYCSDVDLELNAIYEVIFDTVLFGSRYQVKFVGLRKECNNDDEE